MVAVALPVLLLFASFAIDVGNWFEHSRHLQTQADAGALAAGGSFSYPTCDNNAISSMALQYANTENPQVGGTQSNVTALINSSSYANQGGSSFSDGQPCTDGYVDVKMTERNLPLFFGILSLFGRVLQRSGDQRARPGQRPSAGCHGRCDADWRARRQPNRRCRDRGQQHTGATVTAAHLSQDGTVNANGTTLTRWDNTSTALAVTIPAGGADYATVVALGGKAIDLSSGNVGTICAESLVECFAENGAGWQGLSFIHGYATTGTGTTTAPIIRGATLSGGGCSPDAYFAKASCAPLLTVNADFGGAANEPKGAVAIGAGCPNAGCPLTLNGTQWSGTITAPSGTGAFPIAFGFCTKSASCRANQATMVTTPPEVQQMFIGSNDSTISGPVQLTQVSENGGILANSLAAGSHNLVFYVGVQENLANAQSNADQPVQMRLTGNGSTARRTQALDCDPTYPNLKDELANGCRPQYALNTGGAPWFSLPKQRVRPGSAVAVREHPDRRGRQPGPRRTWCPHGQQRWLCQSQPLGAVQPEPAQ